MKKYLLLIFIAQAIIMLSSSKTLGANTSIEVTKDKISSKHVTVFGESDSNSWIIIKAVDTYGNIIFFDSVLTDKDGKYKCTFKLSDRVTDKLKITIGCGSQVIEKEMELGSSEKEDDNSTSKLVTKPHLNKPKVIMEIDGYKQTIYSSNIIKEKGESILEINIDSDELVEEIKKTITENKVSEKEKKKSLEIYVLSKAHNKVKVDFRGDIVESLAQNKYTIAIINENMEYKIPANEIRVERFADSLGKGIESIEDIEVRVQVEKLNESQNYKTIFPPIELSIKGKIITSDEIKEIRLLNYKNYASLILKISEESKLSGVITGIALNEDGTQTHVPTKIFSKNNIWYAKLSIIANSNYSLIENSVEVKSVENHWSKEYVEDMASRLIIKLPESFDPNEQITRGEFAGYITRALGLYGDDVGKTVKFFDVNITSELARDIAIASEYGIIRGYPDGTFKPNKVINREEAMVMYERAMNIVDLKEINNNRIDLYKDNHKVSKWAYNAVKKTLSVGIFNGRTNCIIDPKGTFTHGEAITAIRNLLIKAELIN